MTIGNSEASGGLPPLYAPWIEELLGGSLPPETTATCSNCVMIRKPDDSPDDRQIFFSPHTKCCTFLPTFPNFLAGRILRDKSPELAHGRASLERRLASRVAVTPLGIGMPSSYALWYEHTSGGFGRSKTLLCPHYVSDPGCCGVWPYRNSVCSTFYCKHDRGASGFHFWREALEPLLQAIERNLARWCAWKLGLTGTVLERVLRSREGRESIGEGELDNEVKDGAYRSLWECWAMREREYFKASAELVDDLCWADVESICGPEVRILARLTLERYAALGHTVPEQALRVGSFKVISMRDGIVRLSSYSEFDPIEIPIRLFEVLQHFSGQPTHEAIAAVAAKENVRLDAALVSRLTDFGLLVPAEHEREPG